MHCHQNPSTRIAITRANSTNVTFHVFSTVSKTEERPDLTSENGDPRNPDRSSINDLRAFTESAWIASSNAAVTRHRRILVALSGESARVDALSRALSAATCVIRHWAQADLTGAPAQGRHDRVLWGQWTGPRRVCQPLREHTHLTPTTHTRARASSKVVPVRAPMTPTTDCFNHPTFPAAGPFYSHSDRPSTVFSNDRSIAKNL